MSGPPRSAVIDHRDTRQGVGQRQHRGFTAVALSPHEAPGELAVRLQLVRSLEDATFDPVGVENRLQPAVAHRAVLKLLDDEVGDEGLSWDRDRLEKPEPLGFGQMTQRSGVEDKGPVITHG